jgi:hypothetical protein
MASSKLVILDTGDNYILARDDAFLRTAVQLYAAIDVSVQEVETPYEARNEDVLRFIFDNIGRVFSYGFNDTGANTRIDIPEKLIADIGDAVKFFKVRHFWSGVAVRASDDDVDAEATTKKEQPRLTVAQLLPGWGSSSFETLKPLEKSKPLETPKESDLHVVTSWILLNTLYSIAIVADVRDARAFAEAFPEFRLVHDVSAFVTHSDTNTYAAIRQHFHKVSFSSYADVVAKFDAFRKLYGLDDPKTECGGLSSSSWPAQFEKRRVKEILAERFSISESPDKRLKANDLYKDLINCMCVPYSEANLFKKRVAGYLVEFKLQKKRYSDAYYYYGIERRPQAASPDLAELERRRDSDRKQYFYGSPAAAASAAAAANPTIDEIVKRRDEQMKVPYTSDALCN